MSADPSTTTAPHDSERFTAYQKRLFIFLSIASFFEGYDFFALTQILPNLRAEMALSKHEAGILVAFINFGTVVAYLLVRQADRWGRRRVFTLTIAGYTIATFLTGFAPNAVFFGIVQFIARVFLIAEWAVSIVYAAEEFPAKRRGMVIGVITAMTSLGGIVCAGSVPLLLELPYGWRMVYFVGIAPLILLAFARRSLVETRRFADQVDTSAVQNRSFFHLWHTPYRKRMLQVASLWAMTYVCSNVVVTFWKDFALTERGLSDAEVGKIITIAALASSPIVFYAGKLLDQVGRRHGAMIIFVLTSIGAFGAYSATQPWLITLALVLAIFGTSATSPVLNAFTTELFPTDLRGDAFAWCNNVLGRSTYVLTPYVVGMAAQSVGWGVAVQVTALFPLLAIVLVYALMPETKAKELEDTAALH